MTVSGAQNSSTGGAFRNRGNLTVSNSTISGNSASSGGGFYNGTNGTLTVTNSTISSNTATLSLGGAINSFGTLSISNSTISGNSAPFAGGGINNYGTFTVSNSTISGNSANKFSGGGINNISTTSGTSFIINSTVSGNSASSGGGISNGNQSTLTVTNTTISGNTSGIDNGTTLNIANTIIANSTSGADYTGSGTIGTNTNNLVEDGSITNASSTPTGSGNISGDPLLGTLANNGGPTFTMALGVGSPAIGAANATISNAAPINGLDQRGYTRSSTAPSIGAYEFNGTAPLVAPTVTSISPTSGSTAGGTAITITGTGFTGATAVTIGGTAATNVTVVSSTSITATTPAHAAGTASVLVTTPGGTNAANTLFTYTGAPSPTAPLITGTPPPPSTNGASTVNLYDPITGAETGTAVPFPGFSGPVKVVSGDFNNDGVADIIAGAGFGGGPAIAILDSQTGEVMKSFFAFDPAFTGGVFVAVQDTNGDGILDIIAAAGPGGGPEVRIFNGANLNVLRSFFAYAEDFSGGVSVASIDFNNDGILDLVTGAGPGGAPHVKVFDGATNAVISQWYAYPTDFTGGVFVAVGDIGNDGTFEVVTGAGPGGGPQVNVFSFPALDLLFSFYSGDPANTGGVFVG